MVVAFLGHGTVGGGVYELLKNRSDITVKYVLENQKSTNIKYMTMRKMYYQMF